MPDIKMSKYRLVLSFSSTKVIVFSTEVFWNIFSVYRIEKLNLKYIFC